MMVARNYKVNRPSSNRVPGPKPQLDCYVRYVEVFGHPFSTPIRSYPQRGLVKESLPRPASGNDAY
jgi:hypothetical protein